MRSDAEYLHELRLHKVKLPPLKQYDDAIKAGDRYYQGKPCPHGHPGHRYTRNRHCISCQSMAASKHRHRHVNPSKMVEIDRIKDAKDSDYWDDL